MFLMSFGRCKKDKINSIFFQTFYKNDTEPHPISILGCDLLCPLDRAMELLKPVILNIKQWDLECHSLSAPMVSTIAAIAVISCGVLLLLLLVSLCVSATFSKKEKHRNQFYQPLSDEVNWNFLRINIFSAILTFCHCRLIALLLCHNWQSMC